MKRILSKGLYVALLMLLVFAFTGIGSKPSKAASSVLSLSVIDVGQGDSIFVQFPNSQNILVDAADQVGGLALPSI